MKIQDLQDLQDLQNRIIITLVKCQILIRKVDFLSINAVLCYVWEVFDKKVQNPSFKIIPVDMIIIFRSFLFLQISTTFAKQLDHVIVY